ncbi:MAG TPA: hypothetical protein VGR28_05610, partial [Candidatus Thermoplasmatota archaeon]|nr:hypothetical protein [Candidatus Thermoplasmatota archaeon]
AQDPAMVQSMAAQMAAGSPDLGEALTAPPEGEDLDAAEAAELERRAAALQAEAERLGAQGQPLAQPDRPPGLEPDRNRKEPQP